MRIVSLLLNEISFSVQHWFINKYIFGGLTSAVSWSAVVRRRPTAKRLAVKSKWSIIDSSLIAWNTATGFTVRVSARAARACRSLYWRHRSTVFSLIEKAKGTTNVSRCKLALCVWVFKQNLVLLMTSGGCSSGLFLF